MGGSGSVSDTAYDATSWNGVTDVSPSKNAVRDKIESIEAEISSLAAGSIQILSSDPSDPAEGEAWINTTGNSSNGILKVAGATGIYAVNTTLSAWPAPTLSSITIGTNGTSWAFAYNEAVTCSTHCCDDFTAAMTTAGSVTLSSGSGSGTSTITCTGSPTVNSGDTVANGGVDYTTRSGGIKNAKNVDLASITDKSVTNNSTQSGGGSVDIGINFRGTSGFATDATNETYSLGEAYPTARTPVGQSSNVTFGFDITNPGEDANVLLDRRLRGDVAVSNWNYRTFHLALPSTGTYNIELALGSYIGTGIVQCRIYDGDPAGGGTLVSTISQDGGTSAVWFDAAGTSRTSTTWPTSNTSISHTFAKDLYMKMGNTDGVGRYSTISHVRVWK
jgi:hypothetical protein